MIVCWTLADITKTDFTRKPTNVVESKLRNQQRNYETFLQLIGMRNQPTVVIEPAMINDRDITVMPFGKTYLQDLGFKYNVWMFAFECEHEDAFNNASGILGALISDFDKCPIITGMDETAKITNTINTIGEKCNTFFLHQNQ
mgnify:CR=1 FL=1|tara:strand:+ start:72 stop:500 length:429 start_codon:yes stop_codon:yes gene_type:complete